MGRRTTGFVPAQCPGAATHAPSLKLHVPYHYTRWQVQWGCSGATAALWGPEGSGKGQATLGSTAGMNGLAASRASCSKLYQHTALTDGSPLEKPPAPARVALALAACSPCARCHESGYTLCKRGQHTFKNTRAWFGTLLRLRSTEQAPLEGQAGSLQWRFLWRNAAFCLNLQSVRSLTDDTCFHQNQIICWHYNCKHQDCSKRHTKDRRDYKLQ